MEEFDLARLLRILQGNPSLSQLNSFIKTLKILGELFVSKGKPMFFLGKICFDKKLNYKFIYIQLLETKKAIQMHEVDQQNLNVHDG